MRVPSLVAGPAVRGCRAGGLSAAAIMTPSACPADWRSLARGRLRAHSPRAPPRPRPLGTARRILPGHVRVCPCPACNGTSDGTSALPKGLPIGNILRYNSLRHWIRESSLPISSLKGPALSNRLRRAARFPDIQQRRKSQPGTCRHGRVGHGPEGPSASRCSKVHQAARTRISRDFHIGRCRIAYATRRARRKERLPSGRKGHAPRQDGIPRLTQVGKTHAFLAWTPMIMQLRACGSSNHIVALKCVLLRGLLRPSACGKPGKIFFKLFLQKSFAP